MAHVHAELMKQYAEDAANSETPWDKWEYDSLTCGWLTCSSNPQWVVNREYRRKSKQKFIELNGEKFEIFAEKPEKNTKYWYISDAFAAGVSYYEWANDHYDTKFFETNNCFKTEESARSFAEEFRNIINNTVES